MTVEQEQLIYSVNIDGCGRIINPLLLGTICEDKNRQQALIKTSGASRMIVRPGFLTSRPRTWTCNVTAGKISRGDGAGTFSRHKEAMLHERRILV